MRTLILSALLLSVAPGCVMKSKYVAVQQENGRLKERIEKMDARADAQLANFKELLADMKPLIDRGILKVEVVDGRITLNVASDILFASGSAELSPAGKDTVSDITRLLSKRVGDRDFQVEGHTDDQPINTPQFPSNWHLGAARSIAVVEQMIRQGFPVAHISAASFADHQPSDKNSSEAGRSQNRRIEIALLPDLTEMPGYKKLMAEQPGRPAPAPGAPPRPARNRGKKK